MDLKGAVIRSILPSQEQARKTDIGGSAEQRSHLESRKISNPNEEN